MAERYTRLFSLPENLYSEGAPVVVAAGALLKDSLTGGAIAQLKLQNIQNKVIKSVTVGLSLVDTAGRPLGEMDYQYLDISVLRDGDFGSQTPVLLRDANARGFSAKVKEVVFADNSIWTDAGAVWESLPQPRILSEAVGQELAAQFRIEYGSSCKYGKITHVKDLWICACGALNRKGEAACQNCGLLAAKLENIDMTELRARNSERMERVRKAAMAEDKAAYEKSMGIKNIALAVLVVIIFVVVVFSTFYFIIA